MCVYICQYVCVLREKEVSGQAPAFCGFLEGKLIGIANLNSGLIPRGFWLEDCEEQAIIEYHHEYLSEGYRRPAFDGFLGRADQQMVKKVRQKIEEQFN